jgi:hypothetical protein
MNMLKRILFATICCAFVAAACAPSPSPTVATSSGGEANSSAASCLAGTWKVDQQAYASYMTTVMGMADITVTNIDKPFYYVIGDDSTFSVYMDEITITEELAQPSGAPNIMTITMNATIPGEYSAVAPSSDTSHDGWLNFTAGVNAHVIVTSVTLNGQEIITTGVTTRDFVDPSRFTAVGWDCSGNTLSLSPIIPGAVESSFTLTRDDTWTPPTP